MRCAALFLAVVGARFWLIAHYAGPLPYWDQWDGIGAGLLKPWLEGRLTFHHLLAAHNEHRIVLTRLLSLGLVAANGQWDGRLEMAVNALFCGAGAVALAGMLGAGLRGGRRGLVFAATGVVWALPFGWENTLGGFQSQNYFLIFFSLWAIWGLTPGEAGSRRWLGGLLGLTLASLSMASGFLAAAAALGLIGARVALERRRPGRGEAVTAAVCAGFVVAGWMTRVEVPAHAALKAENAAALGWAAARFLAWPWYGSAAGALAMMAPAVALGWRYVREPGSRRGAGFLLAASGWALLQAVALAYGRGGHGAPPACRYMDLLAIGPLVGFATWLRLLGGAGRGTVAAAVVWTGLLAAGLQRETAKDFRGWLPDFRAQMQRSEANARGYLRTGDFARYLAGRTVRDIPYPDPARLAALLDDPTLRAILPPAEIGAPAAAGGWSRAAAVAVRAGGAIFFAGWALAAFGSSHLPRPAPRPQR